MIISVLFIARSSRSRCDLKKKHSRKACRVVEIEILEKVIKPWIFEENQWILSSLGVIWYDLCPGKSGNSVFFWLREMTWEKMMATISQLHLYGLVNVYRNHQTKNYEKIIKTRKVMMISKIIKIWSQKHWYLATLMLNTSVFETISWKSP